MQLGASLALRTSIWPQATAAQSTSQHPASATATISVPRFTPESPKANQAVTNPLAAAVSLGLVFIGIHNSWDTITYVATGFEQGSEQAERSRPPRDR